MQVLRRAFRVRLASNPVTTLTLCTQHGGGDDRAILASAIQRHIDVPEEMDEAPATVAVERAILARREDKPEDALPMAV